MTKTELHQLAVEMVSKLLHERTGQTLSADRHWRIDTALETVLRHRGIRSSEDLIVLLTAPGDASFKQELVEALLNNETYFYRDRQVFDHLANEVLPALARDKGASRKLSIWSAGCSTGQEPLTLAMILLDQPRWSGWDIDILATDVSAAAIATARRAMYSNFEIQRGLAVGQMLTHFREDDMIWIASDRLRGMIRYERRNLLDGPPPGQTFDLILCRNVLLYLDAGGRRVACRNLRATLADHGRLLLGGGETVLDHGDMFAPVPGGCGLYRPAPSRAAQARRSA